MVSVVFVQLQGKIRWPYFQWFTVFSTTTTTKNTFWPSRWSKFKHRGSQTNPEDEKTNAVFPWLLLLQNKPSWASLCTSVCYLQPVSSHFISPFFSLLCNSVLSACLAFIGFYLLQIYCLWSTGEHCAPGSSPAQPQASTAAQWASAGGWSAALSGIFTGILHGYNLSRTFRIVWCHLDESIFLMSLLWL